MICSHVLGVQGTDTVIEDDIAVGIAAVEDPLDTFQYHATCVVVHGGQEQSENRGSETGDGVALTQVLRQDLQHMMLFCRMVSISLSL